MNLLHPPFLRRGLLLAVLTILPLTAFAQNRPDRGERLKQAFDLTDTQVALVDEAIGDEAERGDLWAVAAALAPTLTDAQKEALFTRPERPARDKKMRDQRSSRGDRPGRRDDDARGDRREARHEAMKADMQAALDLTDAQVQQLEALHAERKAEREALREELRDADRETRRERMQQLRAERPEPGEVPDDLAAILTPEQQEVAAVHRALAAHTMHRLHHARRGHRR
jgi:hypothetical protein